MSYGYGTHISVSLPLCDSLLWWTRIESSWNKCEYNTSREMLGQGLWMYIPHPKEITLFNSNHNHI